MTTNSPALIQMQNRRRFSPLRLLLLLVIIAGVVGPGAWLTMRALAESKSEATRTWFAPYVDVTLTPTLHFEDPAEQPSPDVVLGFVVADPSDSCEPSWGTYYSLDAASRALDLDRRVVRLRERGGDAVVSFGGAVNEELAVVCRDVKRLTAAYQAVIDRYALTVVDFDIEGAAIANQGANERRAAAIKQLQQDNERLEVWLTLPVTPDGMTAEAVALVEQTIAEGVNLTGVNVMTMNYGGSRLPDASMAEASISALNATFQQLDGILQRAGTPRTQQEIWAMLGSTPMIGQNDVSGEIFGLRDAEQLVTFARTIDLRRLSFWSANRDVSCGAVVDDGRVSNTCSGIKQDQFAFSELFDRNTPNSRVQVAGIARDAEPTIASVVSRDDPQTSPYPIWRAARAYQAGDKVVWQSRVYEAKWWSQGDQPDAPVKNVWDTPWRYLGPVLESDREAVRAQEPSVAGEWARWTAERVYIAGDEVQHGDQLFRAKWWTQGNVPQEDPDQPYDHPWEYIGEVARDE